MLKNKLMMFCEKREKVMCGEIMAFPDGSELPERVIPRIEEIISESRVKDIFCVHAVQPVPQLQIGEYTPIEKDYAKDYPEGGVGSFENNKVILQVDAIVGRGIAESLAEYTGSSKAEFIAISRHEGSGVNRPDLGSGADRIIRNANLPVLMLGAPGFIAGS